MTDTHDKKEIYSAISKAQMDFKPLVKDKTAFFGDYASISSINNSIKDALAMNGLAVIQPIVTIDCLPYLKTIIIHSSGECIESVMQIPQVSANSKNFFHQVGSAISYLRRYCLQAMLNISDGSAEDDGDSLEGVSVSAKSLSTNHTQPKKTDTAQIDKDVAKALEEFLGGHDDIKHEILQICGVKSIYEIKKHQLEACRACIRAKKTIKQVKNEG